MTHDPTSRRSSRRLRAPRDHARAATPRRSTSPARGPAVIVMAEMPGISPHVARFSRWVRDAGFTVYMPSLFGRDGAFPDAEEGTAVLQRACVSAEFRAFAGNASSPVTAVAARARAPRARGVRRPGRGRHRHVLHRQLRAHDDARARDARAGAVPAVAAAERSGRARDRARRARARARASRARRPDGPRLSLRGRSLLHGAALSRLRRRARRPLRRDACSPTRRRTPTPRRSSRTSWAVRTAWSPRT